jgi:hypothetical protein
VELSGIRWCSVGLDEARWDYMGLGQVGLGGARWGTVGLD